MSLKKVIFYKITSQNQKLSKIVEVANKHYEKKQELTFLVPDPKAQLFLDKFLWEVPDTSFLPHGIEGFERIQIMVYETGCSLQKHIFNLCPQKLLLDSFLTIYEFEDTTSAEKKHLFQEKIKFYQSKKIPIESY